ncbi:MAG TPA: DUF5946 family protein [Acidobacteriota bacterium]|nr:DUF5946 family protein [Acidobacteriota bacterium]
MNEAVCLGCGLKMPKRPSSLYDGYFNTSPECWAVFTEVLEAEYSNAFLFGRVHQLSVDTYAVQHAGGSHPDKSIDVHLCGLYLVLQKQMQPTSVHPFLRELVARVQQWPHFSPPHLKTAITVFDVAMASNTEEHIQKVREWADVVWRAWSEYHFEIETFVSNHLTLK